MLFAAWTGCCCQGLSPPAGATLAPRHYDPISPRFLLWAPDLPSLSEEPPPPHTHTPERLLLTQGTQRPQVALSYPCAVGTDGLCCLFLCKFWATSCPHRRAWTTGVLCCPAILREVRAAFHHEGSKGQVSLNFNIQSDKLFKTSLV